GDVRDDQGQYVAAKLGEQSCRYLHLDVTSEDDWAVAVAATEEAFGRLDVLVNNAGILTFAPIAEMTLDSFRRVLDVNAVGCWLGMKAVIEPMKRAGGGSIVNISSIEGFTGAAGLSAYSASKFAVRGMTKAAAQELAAFGGRVAIVTGAGNGLGRAEALALARAGARLVLNDLPGDAVQAVAGEIAAGGGQAVVAAGDVADWATGEKLLATALERYGQLD